MQDVALYLALCTYVVLPYVAFITCGVCVCVLVTCALYSTCHLTYLLTTGS